MKSKNLIIALGLILAALIAGLYFRLQKPKANVHAKCSAYSCNM